MKPCAYAQQWSFGYDRIHKPMSEAQALTIHSERKPFTGYTAIFGTPTQPTHSVNVAFNEQNTFYTVTWMDALRRKHTEFQFKLLEPDRLFLILASEFWYEGDTGNVTLTVHYTFRPSGEVHVDKFDQIKMVHEYKDEVVDVSGNWEPLPSFGEYEGLSVKERDQRYA